MSNITIRKKFGPVKLASKYLHIVACLNDIHITDAEAETLGWIATYGFPKKREQKQEFYDMFKRSEPTLNNQVKQLKKKGLIIKEDKRTIIHPALKLNSFEPLSLTIVIENDSQ